MKFMVFTIFSQDLLLYSFNELAAHDMTIEQTSSSYLSYIMVFIVFNMVMYDICQYVVISKNLKLPWIRESELEKSKHKAKIEKAENSEEQHQKASKEQKKKILSTSHSQKKTNKVIPLSLTPSQKLKQKHKENLKKANSLDDLKEDWEKDMEKNNLSMEDLKNRSVVLFLREGIKIEKMGTFSAKTFNLMFLMRLFAFEPLFVSLQMLPTFQVSVVFIIQLIFLIFTYYSIFKAKIYKTIYISFNFFVNETFIFLFILLCLFIAFGGTKGMEPDSWEKLQRFTVNAIIVVSVMNLVIFVLNLVETSKKVWLKYQERKLLNERRAKRKQEKMVQLAMMDLESEEEEMEGSEKRLHKKKKRRNRKKDDGRNKEYWFPSKIKEIGISKSGDKKNKKKVNSL
jgi:cell division protein FtsL